jgi:hypothetical protein
VAFQHYKSSIVPTKASSTTSAARTSYIRISDSLMVLINSLMSRETSLLLKNNSLLWILGNSEKKQRWLLRFLTGPASNQV